MQTRLSPLFLCAFLLVGASASAQKSADVAKRAADISKESLSCVAAIAAARRLSPYSSGRGAAMRRPALAAMSAIKRTRSVWTVSSTSAKGFPSWSRRSPVAPATPRRLRNSKPAITRRRDKSSAHWTTCSARTWRVLRRLPWAAPSATAASSKWLATASSIRPQKVALFRYEAAIALISVNISEIPPRTADSSARSQL